MGQQPSERVSPPAEPIEVWDREIQGDTAPPARRKPWLWLLAAAALVAVTALATVLIVRAAGGDDPATPAKGMTQELAVSYVQSEFPGKYTDEGKLIALFNATCHTLDEGNGSRFSATLPFLQAGLTVDEATYILDMAIHSTCPKYGDR